MTSLVFNLSSLVAGLLFGLGLAISGMTNPGQVLDFLDLAGNWNPDLLFVLGAAVTVTVIAFRWILSRKKPLFSDHFNLPTLTAIDRNLVAGSIIFGIGWGISGYCPGPAIASLANPNWETWVFLPAMLVGMLLQRRLQAAKIKKQ
ncbi:YeeE/YedE family protein [Undibacterium sp. CY18W]|uniref:YeeE/YedE family protein n=1 Tax=Undibacterium hunanense TaxID=2762292 RepID=A0ABR6ZTI0_9BURK|nr:YeeE/YedE family protein [Undibacterium hunanense]MBC3919119.1 YeeE/YedE family protein [Undibacterium hunanense]